jgi:hypothetical protein
LRDRPRCYLLVSVGTIFRTDKVVERAIVLVVLSTSQKFLFMHDPEFCSLDGVVGVKGVRDPMLAVVVSTSSYLDFISYTVVLASLCTIGLDQRRLSSCIVSWVWSGVPLNIDSIGCVVDDVTSGIDQSICWSINCSIGWSICCGIGSGVDWLCYFVFASTFFSHRVEGTLAMTSLARTLRSASASGVGTYCGSAVSETSFFDLSGCNADVGLDVSDHWGIFEVI